MHLPTLYEYIYGNIVICVNFMLEYVYEKLGTLPTSPHFNLQTFYIDSITFTYSFFYIWWPRCHSFNLFHILGCPSRGSNSGLPSSSTTRYLYATSPPSVCYVATLSMLRRHPNVCYVATLSMLHTSPP